MKATDKPKKPTKEGWEWLTDRSIDASYNPKWFHPWATSVKK